jgi:2-oxo-4-hydroxy-4-carboxy-5-ureidoimidazoline decarboxylase
MKQRISLEELNRATPARFVELLGGTFEHSAWIVEAVVDRCPFPTLASLHEAMKDVVRSVSEDRKLALLRQHPDLAGKAALAGTMTDESKLEQGSAGLDRLSPQELKCFQELNSAYRKKFEFPFIICVRRHTKDSIFRNFESRLLNDSFSEHEAALDEIFRITALRLDDTVVAEDRLKVHGFMDTHVIDLNRGEPATGLVVELSELAYSGAEKMLASCTINMNGGADVPFFKNRPIPMGQYVLRFAVGSYFASRMKNAEEPFLDIVPVRFTVREPEGHYHIPLRIAPWAYSIYRGL